MSKRQGGTLNDWMVRPLLVTSGSLEPVECIIGTVTGDDFWEDGLLVRSSLIIDLDEEKGIVETKNTIYKLGAKFNEEV